ncbi:cupin domain-containing protein [Kutzneria buriramensis]|uniref:Cupin domain-containing protein n=1 Tax=Kutzneria buriramensis TaxID=1045776 RepID=A0A3E0H7H1_9PSEU|nr:cupin domain-containing protein [Kutzneria buriramensis]REH39373.1 Cupin domain-containing protein [Kutzneria buriramensis]
MHYLATTELTRGEFGLYRVMMKPRAGGPSTHFHRTISESFYILDGTVRLFDGQEWIEGQAGDFLHMPQGGLHAFRDDADSPAEMLLLFTPGAPRGVLREDRPDLGGRARRLPRPARLVLHGLTAAGGCEPAGVHLVSRPVVWPISIR